MRLVAVLLVVNIVATLLLWHRVSYVAGEFAALKATAADVKTLLMGGLVDRTLLVKDKVKATVEQFRELFKARQGEEN